MRSDSTASPSEPGELQVDPLPPFDTTHSLVTDGSIRRTVLTLAIPVLGEQFLNSLVGLVDVYLAGRLSVDATAAIGLGAYVAWLGTLLFMLIGTGTTALVSRMAGAGDERQANHFFNQSLGLAALMGLVSAVLMYVLAPTFASLQNMDGERFTTVVRFLRIDAIGHLFTSVSLVGAAALRGVGDMRTPLKILAIVNVINMILSYALTFGLGPVPAIGIDGIVIGTVTARTIGGLLTVYVFIRGQGAIWLDAGDLRPRIASVLRVFRIGGPAALDGAIMWSGHFVFLMVIANLAQGELGAAYYAAHIVGIRIESFTYLPALAYSVAVATIVGQSLGARRPDRAARAGHEAALQCGLLALGLAAFYYFGATWLFQLMHENALVREVGPPALRLLAFFQIFLTTSIIYVGALRGAGDTRYPLLMTVIGTVMIRLPVGYYCGVVLDMGLVGAWIGMCSDMTCRAILATWRFARGRWIHTKV